MNLQKITSLETIDSDISSHYARIYQKSLSVSPKLIVELGISHSGNSSKIISLINEEIGSRSIGVDIERCDYSFVKNGTFFLFDDVEFANLNADHLKGLVDVLFVDTSHLYQHTTREIAAWFPLLSESAMIIFHDTNLRSSFVRSNGSTGEGWDNDRGVIRAIEEYFEIAIDESVHHRFRFKKHDFWWDFEHWPDCCGLTCIRKVPT